MSRNKRVKEAVKNIKNYNHILSWDIAIKALKELGFEFYGKSSGSVAVSFTNGDVTFTLHKPHGREKTLTKKDREIINKNLNKLGL